jgi:hypothetical protein
MTSPQRLSPPSTALSLLFLAALLTGIDASQTGQGLSIPSKPFSFSYLPLSLSDLSLALGQKRLTTHALSATSLKESSDTAGLYTICSNYDQADATQRYLASNLGDDYYHPLYLSAKENTACFVAIVDESSVVDLGNLEFIR